MALAIGVDTGLFHLLAEDDSPKKAGDMARTLGMDPALLCMWRCRRAVPGRG